MISAVVMRNRVTLSQWADARGYRRETVNKWRSTYDDFPEPVERITATLFLYDARVLDRWKATRPVLGAGRGGNRKS